jgi:hypothetical protein
MGWGITVDSSASQPERLGPGKYEMVIVSVDNTKRDGSQMVDKNGRPFYRMAMEVVSADRTGMQHSELLYIDCGDPEMDSRTMKKLSQIAIAAGIAAGTQINGPDDFIDRMLHVELKEGRNGYMNAFYSPKQQQFQKPQAPEKTKNPDDIPF